MNSIRRIAYGTILLFSATSTSFALAQSTSSAGAAVAQSKAPSSIDETLPLTGTLFFSQEQRERMDRTRKSGRTSIDEDSESESRRSTINGFVRRSDGSTTVWVDGRGQVLQSGSLADQIRPQSVGTTLTDVRLAVAEHVPLDLGTQSPPRRLKQKKAAANKKAK